MPKQRNTAIGEVECSHRDCELKASIFKFRPHTKNPNAWARRHAGKLYSRCEAGHECRDQEYLLKGKLWGPGEARAVEVEPVKAQPKSEAPALQTPPGIESGHTARDSSDKRLPQPISSSNTKPSSKATFGFWNFRKGNA